MIVSISSSPSSGEVAAADPSTTTATNKTTTHYTHALSTCLPNNKNFQIYALKIWFYCIYATLSHL